MVGKAELAERIAERVGTRTQAGVALDAVLGELTAALSAGERVTLTGFGTFEPAARPARTGRNPRTGDQVEIAASVSARFRPGAGLRSALSGAVASEPAPTSADEDAGSPSPVKSTPEPGTTHGAPVKAKAVANANGATKPGAPAKAKAKAKAPAKAKGAAKRKTVGQAKPADAVKGKKKRRK